MKKFIVYGEYSTEIKDWDCHRNDYKILGFIDAPTLEDAKDMLIDACNIDDINDIDENKVYIVELKDTPIIEVDLETI